jgi:serine/threonine protein kinase
LVYRASRAGKETIVIKQCVGESSEAQLNFLKEAKLLCSLEHENIVTFKGFCYDPCSIMLEYLCFDFSPFKIEKKVSTLVDLVNYVDKVDGESEILDTKTVYKICKDMAEGLSYLHKKDTAHRDLKATNVLVSNKHYCNISDTFVQAREFSKCPIVCKLADFGEGRSREIQTAALHSATRRVDR